MQAPTKVSIREVPRERAVAGRTDLRNRGAIPAAPQEPPYIVTVEELEAMNRDARITDS